MDPDIILRYVVMEVTDTFGPEVLVPSLFVKGGMSSIMCSTRDFED